jgi:leucyl-tRNA synthetase
MKPYQPSDLEPRWQQAWDAARLFETPDRPTRPKWFIMELPPFATGQLHLGHARNYVLADVDARFRRMVGHDVLYTSGYDTFGLPTELAARAQGCSPQGLSAHCCQEMGRQFVRLGLSHDRRRITAYHVPAYYRWVQWVFVRLMKAGHCFRREAPVLWCAQCEVALATSLAADDRCWRCDSPVLTRCMPQWFVRETDFAEEMLDGLDQLPGWPDSVKKIHRDWIGRRTGIRLRLPVRGAAPAHAPAMLEFSLEAGVDIGALRYVAIGRRHPLAPEINGPMAGTMQLDWYLEALDAEGRPVPLPVVVADASEDGVHAGLEPLLDLPEPGIDRGALAAAGRLEPCLLYRLQHWNVARSRYWGPPVPVVHCDTCGAVPVPEDQLPVLLPDEVNLEVPGNPLETLASFRNTSCPCCGRPALRETDTLEAYSSPWWYHWLCKRLDTDNPFEPEDAQAWLPVDFLIGGSDQIRSCFFHIRMIARALRRMEIAAVEEPVTTLTAIGMVLRDHRKMSKSAGNAADLDALITRFGADAVRLAVLSAAAPDKDVNWSDGLVRRQHTFLSAVWAFCQRQALRAAALPEARTELAAHGPSRLGRRLKGWLLSAERRLGANLRRHDHHLAVKNVSFLFERLCAFEKQALDDAAGPSPSDIAQLSNATRQLLLHLSPLAPHLAEELWHQLGEPGFAAAAMWPGGTAASSDDAAGAAELAVQEAVA